MENYLNVGAEHSRIYFGKSEEVQEDIYNLNNVPGVFESPSNLQCVVQQKRTPL